MNECVQSETLVTQVDDGPPSLVQAHLVLLSCVAAPPCWSCKSSSTTMARQDKMCSKSEKMKYLADIVGKK